MWQQEQPRASRILSRFRESLTSRREGTSVLTPGAVWNAGGSLMQSGRVIVDPDEFDQAAASWLNGSINRSVDSRGRCAIGLVGGATPRSVYRALAQEPFRSAVRWQQVWAYFGDERAVPPDHAESNYGMAREALLRHVSIPETQVYRMQAERADREVAAAEYARLLPEHLDILLLGVGTDGHTASLFPGSPALDEPLRRVVAVIGPKPPAARLTITPPVIAAAREVLVLVRGDDKAPVVSRALQGPYAPRDLPVQLAREGTWLLDRAAAAGLA